MAQTASGPFSAYTTAAGTGNAIYILSKPGYNLVIDKLVFSGRHGTSAPTGTPAVTFSLANLSGTSPVLYNVYPGTGQAMVANSATNTTWDFSTGAGGGGLVFSPTTLDDGSGNGVNGLKIYYGTQANMSSCTLIAVYHYEKA